MDPVSLIILATVLALAVIMSVIAFVIVKKRKESAKSTILFDNDDKLPPKELSPFNGLIWRPLKDLFRCAKIAFPDKNTDGRKELKEQFRELFNGNAMPIVPADEKSVALHKKTFSQLPGVEFNGVLKTGEKVKSLTSWDNRATVVDEDSGSEVLRGSFAITITTAPE